MSQINEHICDLKCMIIEKRPTFIYNVLQRCRYGETFSKLENDFMRQDKLP